MKIAVAGTGYVDLSNAVLYPSIMKLLHLKFREKVDLVNDKLY